MTKANKQSTNNIDIQQPVAKKRKLTTATVVFIIFLLVGLLVIAVGVIVPLVLQQAFDGYMIYYIIGGSVVLVSLIVQLARVSTNPRKSEQSQQVDGNLTGKIVVPRGEVGSDAQQYAFEVVQLAGKQKIDEKFAQISIMDRTQFVVYVARLFSFKGYQVRLTPVVNNRGIDMIVEKQGVAVAVGVVHSNNVLSQEDIEHISNGLQFYTASSCMALTNTYFDRTAVAFAKQNSMSLVDRTILAEDFF